MTKVNLYGTGINAATFLMQNRDIDVGLVIEGKQEKLKQTSRFFGYTVDVLDDVISGMKNSYTVVAASEHAFFEIKEKLEVYGLIEYEHFEYFGTFRKKVVFVYGNCHTGPIKDALRKSKEFTDNYGIYPMPPVQDIKQAGINLNVFPLERADVFIHQCIWEKNFYGMEYASENLIKRLEKGCKVIGIPNLYRMPKFLYPQIPEEFDQKYYREVGGCYFNFRDKFIDENCSLSIDEILDLIEDPNLISKSCIVDEMNLFFERLLEREKGWDIKISHFLRENIQKKQCFYDPNHPTGVVIKYISSRILKMLQVDKLPDWEQVTELSTYELPIYASVRHALGLAYDPIILRKNGLKLKEVEMDKAEYIRQYLAWNCSGLIPDFIEHIVYRR